MKNNESSNSQSTWIAPSNIALIKYWGKTGHQLPINPSISLTLNQAVTETTLIWKKEGSGQLKLHFKEGDSPSFSKRMQDVLSHFAITYPIIDQFDFDVFTQNSFPHSCGIASSASSYAAFSLCLNDFLKANGHILKSSDVSSLARQGSGSASRSLEGGLNQWGKDDDGFGDDNYSVCYEKVSPFFHNLGDAIFVVSSGTKSVSSSEGHRLMNKHPFKESRIIEAKKNLSELKNILEGESWDDFSSVVEREALSLHGLMLSSHTPFILLEPNTLKLIEIIKKKRSEGLKICFTLDAGPNLHVLYPLCEKEKVLKFIEDEIRPILGDSIIFDESGSGPRRGSSIG